MVIYENNLLQEQLTLQLIVNSYKLLQELSIMENSTNDIISIAKKQIKNYYSDLSYIEKELDKFVEKNTKIIDNYISAVSQIRVGKVEVSAVELPSGMYSDSSMTMLLDTMYFDKMNQYCNTSIDPMQKIKFASGSLAQHLYRPGGSNDHNIAYLLQSVFSTGQVNPIT